MTSNNCGLVKPYEQYSSQIIHSPMLWRPFHEHNVSVFGRWSCVESLTPLLQSSLWLKTLDSQKLTRWGTVSGIWWQRSRRVTVDLCWYQACLSASSEVAGLGFDSYALASVESVAHIHHVMWYFSAKLRQKNPRTYFCYMASGSL